MSISTVIVAINAQRLRRSQVARFATSTTLCVIVVGPLKSVAALSSDTRLESSGSHLHNFVCFLANRFVDRPSRTVNLCIGNQKISPGRRDSLSLKSLTAKEMAGVLCFILDRLSQSRWARLWTS